MGSRMNGRSGTAEPSAVEKPTTVAARTGLVSRTGARAVRAISSSSRQTAASASASRTGVAMRAGAFPASVSRRRRATSRAPAWASRRSSNARRRVAPSCRSAPLAVNATPAIAIDSAMRAASPAVITIRDEPVATAIPSTSPSTLTRPSCPPRITSRMSAAPRPGSRGGGADSMVPSSQPRGLDSTGRAARAGRAIRPHDVGYTRPTMTNPAPVPAQIPAPPRTFSGIQPSGAPHIGNDLGAIRNYVRLQDEYEAIYCIVDYHALTSTHDPDVLRARTRDMAASLLALGLDPEKCTLFVQSHRPEHAELAWLLATVTPVSWLERTPTYKEKRQDQPDDINHGLLTYPVLQAADIVIYKASLVPVGRDQAAHLELSREIVRAFNGRYGETFLEPQAVFTEAPT